MNNYWRKKHLELIAGGLHIDRDELARFIGPPASAHFVLHSTGDVTAMYPFNRTKLKDENPEQFATQAAVARAKREAMDYTDDMFARTIKRVQALEDGRKPAVANGPTYFAEIDYGSFSRVAAARQERDDLRKENARLRQENTALDAMCDQLRIAGDQQAATIANLEREREHIREGREKAVARCIELEKENAALRPSLTERDLRLATIRSKAERVLSTRLAQSSSVHELVDEACR